MNTIKRVKYVHEGQYVAEVTVEVETDGAWGPTLSLHDAYRLDDIRAALRRGDLPGAARSSRVFTLQPVPVESVR